MGNWLTKTRTVEQRDFMIDIDAMSPAERDQYIRNMALAAFVEIGELLQSLNWKPWHTGHIESSDTAEWQQAVEETVDVLHFIALIAAALHITDANLAAAYEEKLRVNAARQQEQRSAVRASQQ